MIANQLAQMFSAPYDWLLSLVASSREPELLIETLTVLVERGHGGEAQMLPRIVYEHVMTFCWSAVNPEPHGLQW